MVMNSNISRVTVILFNVPRLDQTALAFAPANGPDRRDAGMETSDDGVFVGRGVEASWLNHPRRPTTQPGWSTTRWASRSASLWAPGLTSGHPTANAATTNKPEAAGRRVLTQKRNAVACTTQAANDRGERRGWAATDAALDSDLNGSSPFARPLSASSLWNTQITRTPNARLVRRQTRLSQPRKLWMDRRLCGRSAPADRSLDSLGRAHAGSAETVSARDVPCQQINVKSGVREVSPASLCEA